LETSTAASALRLSRLRLICCRCGRTKGMRRSAMPWGSI
jgi:hypothetical protein